MGSANPRRKQGAWATDRVLSGYYAGLRAPMAMGYVEAVRTRWTEIDAERGQAA